MSIGSKSDGRESIASRRRFLQTTGAVGLVGLAGCSGGDNGDNGVVGGNGSPDHTWTIATVHSGDHIRNLAAERFAEEVESRSDNFDISLSTGGAYGGEIEMIETVQAGGVEMCSVTFGSIAAALNPGFAIFRGYPFMWSDWDHYISYFMELADVMGYYDGLIDDGVYPVTDPFFADQNGIATTDWDEIQHPENMDGLDMYSPDAPGWADALSALGANPQTLALTEVYGAMETGTIQGRVAGTATMIDDANHEIADTYNSINMFINGTQMILHNSEYESLSGEEEDILAEAADIAEEVGEQLAYETFDEYMGLMEEEYDVNVVTDIDMEPFREEVTPVVEGIIEEHDAPLGLDDIERHREETR